MAINFNTEPYYDDFDKNGNFHRILFRPSYAVQARELTQLQTQLQDQLEKFGNHIFRDGSVILNGQRFFEDDLLSIKLGPGPFGNTIGTIDYTGVTVTGESSDTKAVIKSIILNQETGIYNLVVKITSGDAFEDGEDITVTIGSVEYTATILDENAFTSAMGFSVENGVFYVNGKFVYTEAQSIIVDAESNTSSRNIGFLVKEYITTAEDDETLLDNAQGTPNYAAPGADRYSVDLVLTSKGLDENIANFIEIARVVNGRLVINYETTIYSEIGKELARRTFDESGDYTVKKWPLQILEDEEDNEKFVVALDPGKAYIKGFEFETINQSFLSLDKALDVEQVNGLNVSVSYGYFLNVTDISGVFNTTTLESVNLIDGDTDTIGTARIRFLQYVSGTVGTSGAVYRAYLFNISMNTGESFGAIRNIESSTGEATIDVSSRVGGSGDTFLSGTDSPGLVFPFSNQFIKTIRDSLGSSQTEYQFQRTTTSVGFSSGVASFSTANALERFVGGSGALSDTIKDQYFHVVVTAQGTSSFTVGTVLRFNTGAGRSITLSTPVVGSTQSITFDVNDSVSFTATIISTIDANNQIEKTKALSGYSKKVITDTLNTTLGGKDSLGLSDIYGIYGVYNIGSNDGSTVSVNSTTGEITWNSVSYTDVTSNYTLDNGQRVELYDHGSLILSGTAPGNTSDNLLVIYRNFSHTGNGFFSVDSYSIPYEDIPTFVDPASGRTYNLRDCIDFRPRRTDGSSSIEGAQVPNPLGAFESAYQYYLGRMDRIIAMPDKTFEVKQGIPAVNPVLPVNDTNGMVIYEIIIPPYTANIRDIAIKYVDNKRYTMRDIGRLEKRIKNLEYYTQLSLLEKQAKDTSIPDSSNFEKFKNGFAVDPFTSQDIFVGAAQNWTGRRWGWWNAWFNGNNNWNAFGAQNYNENSIAEPANIDFNAAIDPINQELRAPFEVDNFLFDVGSRSNTSRVGDLVTLSFTEENAINQTLATGFINVNPFDVIKFLGHITLEPPFDNWIETNILPEVNKVVDVVVPDAADATINNITGSGNTIRITSTSTSIETNIVGISATSLGRAVVDVQYIPFIRSNTIVGIGKLFKPKSRLWPFVENTSISQHCRPLTLVTVEHQSGSLFDDRQGAYESLSFSGGATAKTALYSPPLLSDEDSRLLTVFNVTGTISIGNTVTGANGGTAIVTDVQTYSLGDPIIPDEIGYIGFEFQIPQGIFKTGERTIRLIDNNTNNLNQQESIGEAKYTATGIIQSTQETILTTRSIQQQRVTTVTGTRVWVDPVAETFLVDSFAYPEGFHLSSVELYFKTKSSTVPVTVQIRRSINGYPESVASIPFAEVTLTADMVNVSEDGSAATKFTFPSPIHLSPNEYAVVVIANTSDYNVFIAEMGEPIIGGNRRVDKQPYNGSLFISQNAGTWTADQNKDLKFKINKAVFQTSGTVEFDIQDPGSIQDYQTLFVNCSTISPTRTNIKWEAKAFTSGDVAETSFTPINVNQDINYTLLKRLADKSTNSGNPTLRLRATLTTENSAVSPAIDTASVSIVAALNIINNDATDEDGTTRGGDALAKYITKPIVLADGFDASNLCVTMDINKPIGTNVKVYFKSLPTEKTTPISDEEWQLMEIESPVPFSVSDYEYREHRFFPTGAFDQYGIPEDAPIDPRFNAFQIKIVLLSSSPTLTPKIRDLRIIALDD